MFSQGFGPTGYPLDAVHHQRSDPHPSTNRRSTNRGWVPQGFRLHVAKGLNPTRFFGAFAVCAAFDVRGKPRGKPRGANVSRAACPFLTSVIGFSMLF